MAGAQILSSGGLQARFAGNTSGQAAAPTAAPTTLHEVGYLSGVTTELDSLLSGGLHPENIARYVTEPASRVLEAVKGQLVGPNGGAVPQAYSAAQPGPAGESVAARGRAILSRLGF